MLIDNDIRRKAQQLSGERFRASTDIPPTPDGLRKFSAQAKNWASHGGFDEIYHDGLIRTKKSADLMKQAMPKAKVILDPRSKAQSLGQMEGKPVNAENLAKTQHWVEHPEIRPPGKSAYSGLPGETFNEFSKRYFPMVDELHDRAKAKGLKIAIVTHNRNIQTENARIAEQGAQGRGTKIDPEVMNEAGPATGTAHKVIDHATQPWDNKKIVPGLYLVRHAQTAWNKE